MITEKKGLVLMSAVILVALLLSGNAFSQGEDGVSDAELQELIDRGDRIAREARAENRTESRLRDALDVYRKVLEIDSGNRHALNRLSLGQFTLAEAYLSEPEKRKSAYRTGYKYGLKSLKVNEDLAVRYEKVGKNALKNLPKTVDDVEALFWTGANLGRLGETKGVMDSLGDLPALIALNRRVLELDEGYLGGAAHRMLGSIAGELLSRLPFTFWQVRNNGFSWEKVRNHFEQAIELAPDCLENYFSFAKYYALKKGQKEMAKELLERTLTGSLGKEYPLVNAIAKEKARKLKEEKF